MTLTDFSYYFRKYLPAAIIGLVFLFVLYFFFIAFFAYLKSQRPKPLMINPVFNILPMSQLVDPDDPNQKPLSFPANAEFIIDTIEGRAITASDTANVYFLPNTTTKLGYVQYAYLMSKTAGFAPDSKYSISGKNLTFDDGIRKLVIDVSSFNFEYKYNYENEPSLFVNTFIPEEQQILEQAKSFLRNVGRYPDELAQGKQHITLFRYDTITKEFTQVQNAAEANAVEVDFFRSDINTFPILPPKYLFSQNYVVMVFHQDNQEEPTIIKSQIKFFEKTDQQVGIYPVKTGEQAFEDLKNHKGLVVSPGTNKNPIMIKKMGMGYLDPDFYQQYLQPVYFFIGDNGFIAYVPAIWDQYIATESAQISQ